MILADTNAWVNHLRTADDRLIRYLGANRVVTCEVIVGELRLGAGVPRELHTAMSLLPRLGVPSASDTLAFIDRHLRTLARSGLGWADVQVVVTAAMHGARLYSHDLAMARAWRALGHRLA